MPLCDSKQSQARREQGLGTPPLPQAPVYIHGYIEQAAPLWNLLLNHWLAPEHFTPILSSSFISCPSSRLYLTLLHL